MKSGKAKVVFLVVMPIMIIFTGCDSKKASNEPSLENVESDQVNYEKAAISGYKNLPPVDFKKAYDQDSNAVLIDVRTPREIASGKIEGALEYNFSDAGFGEKILSLENNKNYYLYCATGLRSGKTARMMIENGFKNVTNMDGSFDELKAKK